MNLLSQTVHVSFYKNLLIRKSTLISPKRNSSTGKIYFKKLFILEKEIPNIFLRHWFPVSYHSKGT